ncbi:hypothetical protein IRJ41_016490 [Triplophysa rosa]|uniref:CCHC-type domain-containing protein n=1 Tax=Triplophysa rosa TaxID=992332 RepID=A0A9W7X033_TRIRA|nr:hypothetical protein IRJ41_016490 [Triplophysa rosa]
MNKAVVVFLKSGIWVKETFVPVTPLSAPATKVTLMRFGKIASPVKTVPLGCKNAALKHVISFRRHVYMFLNSQERTLEVSFRVTHGKDSFMVYASTENMRCFECGDLGHKLFACPHKNEQRASTSRGDGDNTDHSNKAESQGAEEQDQRVTQEVKGQQEVSGIHVNTGSVEEPECTILPEKAVVSVANVNDDDQSDAEDLCEGSDLVQSGVSEENMADETESLSQYTDDGIRDEEQWSDVSNRVETDLYTIDQINTFLDKTKGKTGVDVSEHFPDVEKFISSVIRAKKLSSNDELSQQKRFRLNKHLTVLRTGRKISKVKGKSKK